MLENNSAFGLISDIAAATRGSGNGGDGMFGGYGIWAVIILFALIYGDNGDGLFGGRGGGKGGSCCAPATCADLQRGFDSQAAQQRFNAIDGGLANAGYENAQLIASVNQNLSTGFSGLQNSMNQGFAGLNTGLVQQGYETRLATQGVQAQIAQCCCDEKQLIQQGITQGVMNANAIQQQIQNCCCDMEKQAMETRYQAQADHCQTLQALDKLGDRIENWLVNDRYQNLRDENQQLRFEKSQVAQNQYLSSQINKCPEPAYIVPNPYCCNTYQQGPCCGNRGNCGW